jgi:DNA-binding CsgD family transcriptional regulator
MRKDYKISISSDGNTLLISIPIERVYEMVQPHSVATDENGNVDIMQLTKRQREVFNLLRKGLTYKEIGARLNISTRTAKFHLEQLYLRLNMQRNSILRNFGIINEMAEVH